MKHTARRSDGFTLLELLVTTIMIAVLTIIGIVSYSSVNKRSRDVKRKSDLEQIRSALEMYRSDNGAYPNAGAGSLTLASNLAGSLVSTYIPAIPDDPNGTQHYYYQGIQVNSSYVGYCVSALLETIPATPPQSTCTVSLPSGYNYGLKNP